jgi:hypothetical protein
MRNLALTLIAAALLMSLGTASAATLRLDAVSPTDPIFGFDVLFEDTGDGLLQYEEILSSSGLLFPDGGFFPRLFGVPNLDGVSTIGGPCVDADAWCFLNSEGDLSVSVTTDEFTYVISSVSVDEPAMVWLLTFGLAVLLLRSRRRDTRSGLSVPA